MLKPSPTGKIQGTNNMATATIPATATTCAARKHSRLKLILIGYAGGALFSVALLAGASLSALLRKGKS